MGLLVGVVAVGALVGPPARADDVRLLWPLRPGIPVVTRGFDAPRPDWRPGHRGVDLAGAAGQPVYSPGPGTVVFAGMLAGRPVVSVDHPGGLRTSYEPVQAAVRPGQLVDSGTRWGGWPPGIRAARWRRACTGERCGARLSADYVDPLGLLAATPIRLKPLFVRPAGGPDRGRRAAAQR